MAFFTPFAYREQRVGYKPSDADAEAFLNATGITDVTISQAIDNLVIDLKSNSLWSKFVGLYPFVGGTATTHKYNLKDPRDLDAAYRLTFNGGITHSSDGVKGNGSTGYYDTHYGQGNFTSTSAHVSVYLTENIAESRVDIGVLDTPPFCALQVAAREAGDTFLIRCMSDLSAYRTANTDSRGLFSSNRTDGTSIIASKNTTQTGYSEGALSPSISRNVYGLAMNNDGSADFFTTKNQALSSFGEGLTDTELDNYYTVVQDFQTTLGRNV